MASSLSVSYVSLYLKRKGDRSLFTFQTLWERRIIMKGFIYLCDNSVTRAFYK